MAKTALRDAEAAIFQSLNAVVEPLVRAGLLGPGLLPGGLAVLEVRGRKTQRVHRVPLVATRIGDVLLVATLRGERSQWLRNLRANPEVRSWWNGAPTDGRAVIVASGAESPATGALSSHARLLVAQLKPLTLAGWSFALIVPDPGST